MHSTTSTRLALGYAVATLLASTACGGASGIDLFSANDGGSSGQGSNEAGGSSTSSGSSGASGAAGGSADGGGRDAAADSGFGPGGDATSIACGGASCPLATDVCCLTNASGTGQATTFTCAAAATGCPNPGGGPQNESASVTLKCTGAANCAAGTVCCVNRNDNGVYAQCAATCTGDQAQLCDPAASTTGCSAAQPCSTENIREWRLPRTFGTCGGKGD